MYAIQLQMKLNLSRPINVWNITSIHRYHGNRLKPLKPPNRSRLSIQLVKHEAAEVNFS